MRPAVVCKAGSLSWAIRLPSYARPGLITEAGDDNDIRRIIIPLENYLYGRTIQSSPPPHRFFARDPKGGLYLWEDVRRCGEVILVEGLFDYAVLMAGRLSPCHLLAGKPSQRPPVPATV